MYRANRILTVIGVMLPWVANAFYVIKIFPLALDLTPAAFAFTGLATTWGLIHPKYLDMVPLARRMVIENMTDRMFVIDQQNNIVDINHAAERFLNLSASGVLGSPIEQVFANQTLAENIRNLAQGETEIQLEENKENRWYDLRISALPNPKGQAIGRIITLRDITQRKETEVELNRRLSESLALNRIIWAISAAPDPNAMLQVACRQLAQALNLAHTAFAFWDDEKQMLQVTVEYYSTGNVLQSNQSIPIPANSDVAYCLRQNVPLVIPNAQLYSLPDQAQGAEWRRSMPSMLLTPVTANNRIIGAFCLDAPSFREITSDEVALTQNVALVIGAIARDTFFLHTERASAESAHPEAPLAKMSTEPAGRVRQLTRELARPKATTAAPDPALAPGVSENSHTLVLLGVSAFRQGDKAIACESFIEAIGQANTLLAQTPRSVSALDAKGIALCGLALGDDNGQERIQRTDQAVEVFRAARAINKDAGVVARVVRLLDALALAVPDGAELSAEARKAASGE